MKCLTDDLNFEFDELTYKPVGIHEKYNKIYWAYHASRDHIKEEHREFIKKRIEETGITL